MQISSYVLHKEIIHTYFYYEKPSLYNMPSEQRMQ